jgi:hypothetical protein
MMDGWMDGGCMEGSLRVVQCAAAGDDVKDDGCTHEWMDG